VAKWLDDTWHGGKPRPWPHCVRWGPAPPPQKGHSPQFSAHVCCGQTAGWIKMPLGTEVDLGPCNIVLDGDPAHSPPKKGGTAPPIFAHVLWPNGCMDQDATCYGGRHQLRSHCVTWGTQLPRLKRGTTAPNFRPMSVVAKRLHGSRCHLVWR